MLFFIFLLGFYLGFKFGGLYSVFKLKNDVNFITNVIEKNNILFDLKKLSIEKDLEVD